MSGMASPTSYRDYFPDIHDEGPQVVFIQCDGDPAGTERRVLATAASLRVGDRLYVSIAPFGHTDERVPTEIIDNSADRRRRVTRSPTGRRWWPSSAARARFPQPIRALREGPADPP